MTQNAIPMVMGSPLKWSRLECLPVFSYKVTTRLAYGIPQRLATFSLQGLGALLATVQMPSEVPVTTVVIGKAGADNAGIAAAPIMTRSKPEGTARRHSCKTGLAAGGEQVVRTMLSQLQERRQG